MGPNERCQPERLATIERGGLNLGAQIDQVQAVQVEPVRAKGAIRRRVFYGAFLITLVVAAPLGGRIAGTAWGAINAYRNAMELFHNKKIAMNITTHVLLSAYRAYLYGK